MTLKQRISADFLTAFKAGNKERKLTLSMLKSAITEAEKAEGQVGELTDTQVLDIVKKYAKTLGQTVDMIKDETNPVVMAAKAEMLVVADYLPEALSIDRIKEEVNKLVGGLDASNDKNKVLGTVMNYFKQMYNGQYNPKELKTIVDQALSTI